MNEPDAIPWDGLIIAGTTVVVVFALITLLTLLVLLTFSARDGLRERYFGGGWSPHSADLLGVPAWFALEVVCLLGGLLLAVITAWATYSLARDFRDWWHKGDRSR